MIVVLCITSSWRHVCG